MHPDLKYFENIYSRFNKPSFISPDPLQFLSSCSTPLDREIIALIASSLAYGRVKRILISVKTVIDILGDSPADFLKLTSLSEFRRCFRNFKHRFTTGEDIALFLDGIKKIIEIYGSVGNCFAECYSDDDVNIIPSLVGFCGKLTSSFPSGKTYLFPSPERGSACKRPMLFLRWMVRNDDVDPGHWSFIPNSKLIIPLDTHMHQFALKAGFTERKNADLAAALEITESFRKINPGDPVKYDFALTRFGIRGMESHDLNPQ
jgi:uncharacterized protein (TIGR02757 family)